MNNYAVILKISYDAELTDFNRNIKITCTSKCSAKSSAVQCNWDSPSMVYDDTVCNSD